MLLSTPLGSRQWLYSGTTLLITPKEKSETDKPRLLTKAEFIKSLENSEILNWTGFAQSWYNYI